MQICYGCFAACIQKAIASVTELETGIGCVQLILC